MHSIWLLLGAGFVLGLDNFRVAIVLGTVPFSLRRAFQVALIFGVWDGVMPLMGLLLGRYAGQAIGPISTIAASIALGGYGLYLLIQALRNPESPDEIDNPWVTLFGIPLSLSLDNLVGGASLGLLGFAPWVTAIVFGAATAVMTLIGLHMGRFAAHLIRIRSDLLSGVALMLAAVTLPLLPN
ncbi:manganese efflux pump MntP family protein [Streptomyces aurantiacus]|uniref:Manganese efflux pump MntP n=1 Tax=Streptomyces aurantiacus TaxID=47760 RepID=A0A7G1NY51_9ACTN|nr:manganese efflux pump [Streptomyces aurantiacus]BCL26456.1 putative manganese efflux pump MntP [Streptomyces aurantiacus]